MAEALVLLERQEQSLRAIDTELLTLARRLGSPVVLWAGEKQPSGGLQDELRAWGVERVDWLRGPEGEDLTDYVAQPLARTAAQVILEGSPRAVLAASNFATKEFAAHLGEITDSGVLTDLSEVEIGEELIGKQMIFAGTWHARSTVTRGTPILLLQSSAVEPQQGGPTTDITVREVSAANAFSTPAARITERTAAPGAAGPDLASAPTVVVGGRGTEGEFEPVRILAEELDAAVGATRVATDEGWIDPATQVGQTGVTIMPRLYIGAGVSGAVHHRSGMQSSEVIVAINSDSDAPLFDMADFGVVGDLHEILPQAAAELRRLRER